MVRLSQNAKIYSIVGLLQEAIHCDCGVDFFISWLCQLLSTHIIHSKGSANAMTEVGKQDGYGDVAR